MKKFINFVKSEKFFLISAVIVSLCGGAISLIPFINVYPFLPGPDTPLYLYEYKSILMGKLLPPEAWQPILFAYLTALVKLITHLPDQTVFALIISLLSGINTFCVYVIANNTFGKKTALLAALLSLGVYGKYRLAWDLYNNYLAITALLILIAIYPAKIGFWKKNFFLFVLSFAVFFSHPLVGILLIIVTLLFLITSLGLKNRGLIRESLCLVLINTLGFIAAGPFTFKFFFPSRSSDYLAKTLLENKTATETGNFAWNVFLNLKNIPFQLDAFLTWIQKFYLLLGIVGLIISLIYLFKQFISKKFNSALIMLLIFSFSLIGLSQTELLKINTLPDRFVMMLYPAAPVFAALAIIKIREYLDKNLRYLGNLFLAIIIIFYLSNILTRAVNYNRLNLQASIDQTLYAAIQYLDKLIDHQKDLVLSNNLYHYWIKAYIPDINYTFGEYYLISGVKWTKWENPDVNNFDWLELNSAILTKRPEYSLGATESAKILSQHYSQYQNIYLFMKKNELPGYTDWEKFYNFPQYYQRLYEQDGFFIFRLIE
jgi:hypothetical protein